MKFTEWMTAVLEAEPAEYAILADTRRIGLDAIHDELEGRHFAGAATSGHSGTIRLDTGHRFRILAHPDPIFGARLAGHADLRTLDIHVAIAESSTPEPLIYRSVNPCPTQETNQ